MKNKYEFTWSTLDEIKFLRWLGLKENIKTKKNSKSRLLLLENYKQTITKRVRWGKINKLKVIKYLNKYISIEKNKQ